MSASISSIFLVCRDLPGSVGFYQRLGFPVKRSSPRTAILRLGHQQQPELHLHAELSAEERERYGDICWQPRTSGVVLSFATDDIEALLEKVPPESRLAGPIDTPWGARIILLVDPDGYQLEFAQR